MFFYFEYLDSNKVPDNYAPKIPIKLYFNFFDNKNGQNCSVKDDFKFSNFNQ